MRVPQKWEYWVLGEVDGVVELGNHEGFFLDDNGDLGGLWKGRSEGIAACAPVAQGSFVLWLGLAALHSSLVPSFQSFPLPLLATGSSAFLPHYYSLK